MQIQIQIQMQIQVKYKGTNYSKNEYFFGHNNQVDANTDKITRKVQENQLQQEKVLF